MTQPGTTRIRIVFLCLAGLLVAGVALGANFWDKKDYTKWSEDEVRKIMTNSPWVKEIAVPMPAAAGVRGARAEQPGGPGGPGGDEADGAPARGRGRRGGGGGDATPAATQVLLSLRISWRSAMPLRQAAVKSSGANSAEAEQALKQPAVDYVIVVSGVPARLAALVRNPETLKQSLLKVGKREPVMLDGADFQERTQTLDVFFIFHRREPITLADKEVEVLLKVGPIEAKKKFDLKDMVYKGKLEL